MTRGYFGVVAHRPKRDVNVGGMWRAAHVFGAAFIATIGMRYDKDPTDTTKAARHVPLFNWLTVQDFLAHRPSDAQLVAVEFLPDAIPLPKFRHPERGIYVFGAEDGNVPKELLVKAQSVVMIPSAFCLNLAASCNVVLYDRMVKSA